MKKNKILESFPLKKIVINIFFYFAFANSYIVIGASQPEISDFGEPISGHFFLVETSSVSSAYLQKTGKMEIQGTPDQNLVRLLGCDPYFFNTRPKVRETILLPTILS